MLRRSPRPRGLRCRGELGGAFDHAPRTGRRGRDCSQSSVAKAHGGVARSDTQLSLQRPLETLELAKCGVPVTPCQLFAHEGDVGALVGRSDRHEVGPALGQREDIGPHRGESLVRVDRPVLESVAGQQLTGVRVGGFRCEGGVFCFERATRQLLESDGVDRDIEAGEQGDVIVSQDDRVRLADRLTREVRGLVQLRQRLIDVLVGPQRVEDSLAVHPSTRRQCEQLDQTRGMTSGERSRAGRTAVDHHVEAAQQRDADVGHSSPQLPSGTPISIAFGPDAIKDADREVRSHAAPRLQTSPGPHAGAVTSDLAMAGTAGTGAATASEIRSARRTRSRYPAWSLAEISSASRAMPFR